jgi:hypothetical protein
MNMKMLTFKKINLVIILLLDAMANYFWLRAIRKHGSRMGRNLAPKYTVYLKKARAKYRSSNSIHFPGVNNSAIHYHSNGFSSYKSEQTHALAISMLQKVLLEELDLGVSNVWGDDLRYLQGDIFQKFPEVAKLLQGEVGALIEGIFGSNFKV